MAEYTKLKKMKRSNCVGENFSEINYARPKGEPAIESPKDPG